MSLFFVFFFFRAIPLCHMQVPRLGAESQLQLPSYTTATAMPELSHVCNLHQAHGNTEWILNPLSKARNQTCILMDTSWFLNPLSHNGNSNVPLISNNNRMPFLSQNLDTQSFLESDYILCQPWRKIGQNSFLWFSIASQGSLGDLTFLKVTSINRTIKKGSTCAFIHRYDLYNPPSVQLPL